MPFQLLDLLVRQSETSWISKFLGRDI